MTDTSRPRHGVCHINLLAQDWRKRMAFARHKSIFCLLCFSIWTACLESGERKWLLVKRNLMRRIESWDTALFEYACCGCAKHWSGRGMMNWKRKKEEGPFLYSQRWHDVGHLSPQRALVRKEGRLPDALSRPNMNDSIEGTLLKVYKKEKKERLFESGVV